MKRMIIYALILCVCAIGIAAFVFIAQWLRSWNFISAAQRGDLQTVQDYIKSGIDVNTIDFEGLSAINCASAAGHDNIVKMLLEAGASPNEGLYQAILLKNVSTINLLISRGADINKPDERHGVSPLEFARHNSNEKIVKLLKSK